MSICQECNREYEYDRTKGHKKTICNSCSVVRSRRRIKEKAVAYKGGQCQVCGYSKYLGALAFHHLDPTRKDFGLSTRGLYRSWKRVKGELDKCVLVCNNCHSEIHGGITQLTQT